ncbi:MAG TPA: phospholipase D-like domain-containing protein, partial [Terriglobia bacterium]|nr:phospholipase D-like domain-containing protein [Terriglobia bacterium]
TGQRFVDAFMAKAREGVRVRVIYDWVGALGNSSGRWWRRLREAGVEVRCYNPPRFDSPLGWLSRDHRKLLSVDRRVSFISGLCVGNMWVGDPEKNIEPWRDTGIELRGPGVTDVETAFAQIWAMLGKPLPVEDSRGCPEPAEAGVMNVRIVGSLPSTAGMIRMDQLVAALARKRLWLSDAYYAGTTSYVQALRAAAKDGVDVRLLLPNSTDIPLLKALSRAGYRSLLEAGVRVFEWNGPMMHAKTAVADGRWGRVGSTNLNIASWFGNCELDAVVEDESFALQMEEMYLQDLTNATEVVLDAKRKMRAPRKQWLRTRASASGGGSTGRAAAGAVRIGNALGAAFTNRRVLEPLEARIMITVGLLFFGLAVLFAFFPWILIVPLVIVFLWIAVALLYRGIKLHRQRKRGSG